MSEHINEILISLLVLILLVSCLGLYSRLKAEIEKQKILITTRRIAEILALAKNLEGVSLELGLPNGVDVEITKDEIRIGKGISTLYIRIPEGVRLSFDNERILITKA